MLNKPCLALPCRLDTEFEANVLRSRATPRGVGVGGLQETIRPTQPGVLSARVPPPSPPRVDRMFRFGRRREGQGQDLPSLGQSVQVQQAGQDVHGAITDTTLGTTSAEGGENVNTRQRFAANILDPIPQVRQGGIGPSLPALAHNATVAGGVAAGDELPGPRHGAVPRLEQLQWGAAGGGASTLARSGDEIEAQGEVVKVQIADRDPSGGAFLGDSAPIAMATPMLVSVPMDMTQPLGATVVVVLCARSA